MIQNTKLLEYKIIKNSIIQLKNVNPNGCNVVINNLHPMVLFFQKILKIELNKGLQSLF